MTCESARNALLEADPAALAGDGDDPVARHVRACGRCARVAGFLLDAQGTLASDLGGDDSALDQVTLARILSRAAEPSGDGTDATAPAEVGQRGPWARRLRRSAWIPALAAAGLTALALWPDPPTQETEIASAPAADPFAVEPAEGRDIAVFETNNPAIKVIWFLQGDEA